MASCMRSTMLKLASQSDDYTVSTAPLQSDVDNVQPTRYHSSSHQAHIAAKSLDSRTYKHVLERSRHAADHGQGQNQPALRLAEMYQRLMSHPVWYGITYHTQPSEPPSFPKLASLLKG